MDNKSDKEKIWMSSIKKEIQVYLYGKAEKKILLVHRWSGHGTQLVKIADKLLEMVIKIVSFNAPAHVYSKESTSLIPEFIAPILELEKQFGPLEFAIGHSLGGMSILNAVKQKLNIKKAVIIGSGDVIQDIIEDFIKKLQLKPKIAT